MTCISSCYASNNAVHNESTQQPESVVLLNQSIDDIAADMGGDINAQLAAMVLKNARDNDKETSHARMLEEREIRQENASAVSEMRDKADDMRAGAWISGGLQAIGGGLSMLSTFAEIDAKGFEAKEDTLAQLDASSTAAWLQGGSSGAQAASGIVQGGYQAAAVAYDASITQATHQAEESERRLDTIAEHREDSKDAFNAAMDFLREVNKIEHDTNLTIIRA
jgi:hypothetical protein